MQNKIENVVLAFCYCIKNNENVRNCDYYNIDEIQTLSKLNHEDALSLFHINTCSLPKNIQEIEYLIVKTKVD